jgi:hypothetical protein
LGSELSLTYGESAHNELPLRIGFTAGVRFSDDAGKLYGVHDTLELK